ncbi:MULTISPECIES: MFS transporter [unclassified Adlercreutzia]|uniref:MFS transporter n=1 Tax=unclassified Adlercreutzia TaxID=2636013 RepID=UPI0013EABEE9|nr:MULTISPECIES: MFS transporter [unclassified Adlercreutzia]
MADATADTAALDPNLDNGATIRRVAVSSFLGNFIEWFDYASYSYFATVIAAVFFASEDPTAALISTFAVFAVSFIMRPVGALFWGSLGDKKGRKWALSVSIFLMSGATFLIGCLPTYAMIGLGAPLLLLLLRMVQGFSAAGEYAGAATFLAEYAPQDKRGLYCSLVPASTAVGLLVGSTLATIMTIFMPEEAVNMWGWRIPFLLAGPLGLIAHYIRTRLEDSPTYQSMQENLATTHSEGQHPIRDLCKNHLRELIVSFGACMLNAVGFYAVLTYLPTYLETAVGMPADESQLATTISLVAYIAFIFISGKISDRFGRKKMLISACVLFIVLTVPAFMLLNTAQFIIVLGVELVMCFVLTINDGTLSSYLTETFPTDVRYTGFALSFNLANAIFGGTAAMIGTALISATGSNLAPAWYMVVVAVVALVAMILSHENSHKHLDEIGN